MTTTITHWMTWDEFQQFGRVHNHRPVRTSRMHGTHQIWKIQIILGQFSIVLKASEP